MSVTISAETETQFSGHVDDLCQEEVRKAMETAYWSLVKGEAPEAMIAWEGLSEHSKVLCERFVIAMWPFVEEK